MNNFFKRTGDAIQSTSKCNLKIENNGKSNTVETIHTENQFSLLSNDDDEMLSPSGKNDDETVISNNGSVFN